MLKGSFDLSFTEPQIISAVYGDLPLFKIFIFEGLKYMNFLRSICLNLFMTKFFILRLGNTETNQ